MHLSTVFVAVVLVGTGVAGYSLVDDYSASNFFSMFDFHTGPDPTNGFVNYVDQGTAQSQGLINTDGSVYIGVDSTNIASGGRNSVRLSSKKSYNHMLVVIDLGHMPGGQCGAWPAFWSFGPGWPASGEIDIIENVNDQTNNWMTLHSSPNCAISDGGNGLLQPTSQDCNTAVNGNQGCSFHDPDSSYYGEGLNNAGGAIYAMEWTSTGISIWRWRRNGAPGDVLDDNPNPQGWGQPSAQWQGNGCDWDGHFSNHNLIFDTTFCGDWAGNAFQSCSARNGGQTCKDFVANNPSAFRDAFWSVNALKVYQDDGTQGNQNFHLDTSSTPVAVASSVVVTPTPVAPPPVEPTTLSVKPSSPPAQTGTPLQSGQFGQGSQGIPSGNNNGGNNSGNNGNSQGQPLQSGHFGQGSQGIPAGNNKRAAHMGIGERRMRRHLKQHARRQAAAAKKTQ